MGGGSGEVGEVVTWFLADADAGLAEVGCEAGEAIVVAFGGHHDVVKAAPAGLEGFGYRVHAVEDFHEG